MHIQTQARASAAPSRREHHAETGLVEKVGVLGYEPDRIGGVDLSALRHRPAQTFLHQWTQPGRFAQRLQQILVEVESARLTEKLCRLPPLRPRLGNGQQETGIAMRLEEIADAPRAFGGRDAIVCAVGVCIPRRGCGLLET
jgi:hypothetical protein